jgi:Mg-chelatase subunit ChlD
MKTKLIGTALVAFTVAAVVLYPDPRGGAALGVQSGQPPAQAGRQKIEVVFVLDTTSSMSGLIDTAKEKIWSIATTMAEADQTPEIEMGLVAFRDRGDDYVTKVVDLSPDLDSMYGTLMQFAAVGGGDGPESVNVALDAAVNRISWSNEDSTYRVVFLVGDAPPHMDYQGERQYPEIVRAAAERGIVVNTIQCGTVDATVAPWTAIADLGHGRYMRVEQTGGAFAVATPYDDDIARLSAELDATRLYYGDKEERAAADLKMAATERLHALASSASRAGRAAFNATASGAANLFGAGELVDEVASGRKNLADIPEEELPEPVRALAPEAQEALITETAERRDELQQRIRSLVEAREGFIAEQVDAAGGARDSLDRQIYDVVREQGAAKGLIYEAGPTF